MHGIWLAAQISVSGWRQIREQERPVSWDAVLEERLPLPFPGLLLSKRKKTLRAQTCDARGEEGKRRH